MFDRHSYSLITSVGIEESSLWTHSPSGDKSISSEGEIIASTTGPTAGFNAQTLYYLIGIAPPPAGPNFGAFPSTAGAPSQPCPAFLYPPMPSPKMKKKSFIRPPARADRLLSGSLPYRATRLRANLPTPAKPRPISAPAAKFYSASTRPITTTSVRSVLMVQAAPNFSPIPLARSSAFRLPAAGSSRSCPISIPIKSASPPSLPPGVPRFASAKPTALPVGRPTESFSWSRSNPNPTLVPAAALPFPSAPQESIPPLPLGGIPLSADPSSIPDAVSINREQPILSRDPVHFAYVNRTVHRDIYRISLP